MTTNLKISWLEKKSKKQLDRVWRKYHHKAERVLNILRTCKSSNIKLPDETIKDIIAKYIFYQNQIIKIWMFTSSPNGVKWEIHPDWFSGELQNDFWTKNLIKQYTNGI